jgi:hypothetical protein
MGVLHNDGATKGFLTSTVLRMVFAKLFQPLNEHRSFDEFETSRKSDRL